MRIEYLSDQVSLFTCRDENKAPGSGWAVLIVDDMVGSAARYLQGTPPDDFDAHCVAAAAATAAEYSEVDHIVCAAFNAVEQALNVLQVYVKRDRVLLLVDIRGPEYSDTRYGQQSLDSAFTKGVEPHRCALFTKQVEGALKEQYKIDHVVLKPVGAGGWDDIWKRQVDEVLRWLSRVAPPERLEALLWPDDSARWFLEEEGPVPHDPPWGDPTGLEKCKAVIRAYLERIGVVVPDKWLNEPDSFNQVYRGIKHVVGAKARAQSLDGGYGPSFGSVVLLLAAGGGMYARDWVNAVQWPPYDAKDDLNLSITPDQTVDQAKAVAKAVVVLGRRLAWNTQRSGCQDALVTKVSLANKRGIVAELNADVSGLIPVFGGQSGAGETSQALRGLLVALGTDRENSWTPQVVFNLKTRGGRSVIGARLA